MVHMQFSQSSSSTSSLSQLLQHSPDELSSGVLIAEWIQSKAFPAVVEFDLSQIEPGPKDSVTKYLNWVCLNAKVFNNYGILLNSSQINNFIEGKSTEIYIILKQLYDKIKEKHQQRSCIISTKSAPSPSIPTNPTVPDQAPNIHINKIKSTTAIGLQRRRSSISSNIAIVNEVTAVTPNKAISSILTSPSDHVRVNNHSQIKSSTNHGNFPSLSLAISPTISHDRIEKVATTSNEHYPNSIGNSKDITNHAHIGTIKEHEADNVTTAPTINTLSLLSPDLNEIVSTQNISETQFRTVYNENSDEIKKDPIVDFEQFEDYIVYDGMELFGQNMQYFLDEKKKLEDKLNDAMCSYQSNNSQYLNNIVEQYRTQKLKLCQSMKDQLEHSNFLKKLQNDLDILDKSLRQQFEESKKTLYNQLSTIHQNRLKEFVTKLKQKSAMHSNDINQDTNNKDTESIQLQTSINVNSQNINIPTNEVQINNDDEDKDEDELNVTLKEVSSLLEKCWKNEMKKQQKQRSCKPKEMRTLKEILSVYQNLSKLIQLQSNTLKTTIIDFENLCHESYNEDSNDDTQNISAQSTQHTSPDKMKIPYDYSKYYQMPNNTQIQLLSSSGTIPKPYYYNYTNEDHMMPLKSTNNGRKKRRKSWNKKSMKNSSKTPAFSFVDPKYNRQTVSSHNKKVSSKKKLKKSKKTI